MGIETDNDEEIFFDQELGLENLSIRFSVDDLSSFKDMAHLVSISLEKIREAIPSADPAFYLHDREARDFHEILRDGIFSVPDDSLFTGFLSMNSGIIAMKDLEQEPFFSEDDLLRMMVIDTLRVSFILPVIHKYQLLGFVTISFYEEGEYILSDEDEQFLKLFAEALRINLYAATLVDDRLKELSSLSSLSDSLRNVSSFGGLSSSVTALISPMFSFDMAVYYEFDKETDTLIPRSSRGIAEEQLIPLSIDEGLNGYVFKKQKPALITSFEEAVFYRDLCTEEYITGSCISMPVTAEESMFGVITVIKNTGSGFGVDNLYIMRIMTAMMANELENKRLYQKLQNNYLETVAMLSKALEAKDNYTRGHSQRVMEFCVGIAGELGFTPEKRDRIKIAALFHDIGKIGISENILNKPDKLSAEEFEIIRSHPSIGADIVASIETLSDLKDIIRYHHEKLNGLGYYGKKAGEYPWESTIIALADIYDALTSNRPYRTIAGTEEVVDYLYTCIGEAFDDMVFGAFLRYMKKTNQIDPGYIPDSE
ncbi:MAG: HD domain-containing protein [Spirochaetaceae bacterium]|jgi:putative nucleotidyltransferase with HDIG domain|nr:HD domain-containing protein [Spirochaetaceae bacterium]